MMNALRFNYENLDAFKSKVEHIFADYDYSAIEIKVHWMNFQPNRLLQAMISTQSGLSYDEANKPCH
jgi:hypothetical protein